MSAPIIDISLKIDEINIYKGETLTVWLNKFPKYGFRDAVQVELRVNSLGKVEIFTDHNTVRPFREWREVV